MKHGPGEERGACGRAARETQHGTHRQLTRPAHKPCSSGCGGWWKPECLLLLLRLGLAAAPWAAAAAALPAGAVGAVCGLVMSAVWLLLLVLVLLPEGLRHVAK